MDSNDIDDAIEARAILMASQVVPYKVHIRKIVEAATVSEINRWDLVRRDAVGIFRNVPIVQRRKFLPWLILLLGIATAYYFLTPLFN